MMRLRPLSGTDEHEYAQLVKLLELKEKGYVSRRRSRRPVLLFFDSMPFLGGRLKAWDGLR